MNEPTTRRGFLKQAALSTGAFALGESMARNSEASPTPQNCVVHNEDEPGAPVGARPYEMDWAKRFEPAHPQIVDFDDLTGWRLHAFDGAHVVGFRSREEQLFGQYTAKVVYAGASEHSRFVLEPPQPMPLPRLCDAVDLWVRGNNWEWMNPPKTARTEIFVLLQSEDGSRYRLKMGVNNFDYWFLFHSPLMAADGKTPLYKPVTEQEWNSPGYPMYFAGIEVAGCWNQEPARLYFDALSFYQRNSGPLTFEPVPEKLPWPTTSDTILPTVTEGSGPVPSFRYIPSEGTLSDLSVTLDGQTFQPCLKGGIRFEVDGEVLLVGHDAYKPRLTGERRDGNRQCYDWEIRLGAVSLKYSFGVDFRGKSCIIDITADGGRAIQFDIGVEKGLPGAKTVKVPYLAYSWDGWPRLVCGHGDTGPVFLMALMDHYNSDASELFGAADLTAPDAVGYTGGARYKPTTAGVRNPMRERLFVNVSTDVHEVLPNIPNPVCDTGDMARECLCNNLGDSGYPFPYELLRRYKAYGITKYIVNHHEDLWRRGGESFTIRERPAPEIGEDALAEYGAFVRSLGYRFGLYQNFADLAPVNAAWNEDDVCRNPDGAWKLAWPRNYALKPLRAAELEAVYAARLHRRFGTSASCIDVHTALTPWERTDYDARTPGAGKFRTQFDAYGRLLVNESKVHEGPAISEGNYHWFYAGISDGNYATILPFGSGHTTPPLVDFDLLKMHPKMTDLGMGSPYCFYGAEGEWRKGPSRLSESFDRYIAATIAYGHMGYLAEPWGFSGTLKSYYLVQALQQRYLMVPVSSIRYFDGQDLIGTSAAIATDAYQRGQVHVEYENGLRVWCNLSSSDEWRVTVDGIPYRLPAASFVAWRPGDILAYSAEVGGKRHELVSCKDHLYLDSRDQSVSTTAIAACGAVAVKPDGPGTWWVIPATEARDIQVSLDWLDVDDASRLRAHACDGEGREIGPVRLDADGEKVTLESLADRSVVKYRLECSSRCDAPRET